MNDDFENDAADNANFGKLAYGTERLRTGLATLVRWMKNGGRASAVPLSLLPDEQRAIAAAYFAEHFTSAATTAKFSNFLAQFYELDAAVSTAAQRGSVEGLHSNIKTMQTGHGTLAELVEELNCSEISGESLRRFAV